MPDLVVEMHRQANHQICPNMVAVEMQPPSHESIGGLAMPDRDVIANAIHCGLDYIPPQAQTAGTVIAVGGSVRELFPDQESFDAYMRSISVDYAPMANLPKSLSDYPDLNLSVGDKVLCDIRMGVGMRKARRFSTNADVWLFGRIAYNPRWDTQYSLGAIIPLDDCIMATITLDNQQFEFHPTGRNVLFRVDQPKEYSDGGILIPDTAKIRSVFVEILEVGPNAMLDIQPGQRRLLTPNCARRIETSNRDEFIGIASDVSFLL